MPELSNCSNITPQEAVKPRSSQSFTVDSIVELIDCGFAVIGLLVVKQFIYGATFSLNCFPAENAGTLVAGIVIGSLVFGLRPSLLKAMPKAASYASLESPKPIK